MKIKEFIKKLNSFDLALRDQFIKQELNKCGLQIIDKTKPRTPVKTGLLKRSWWVTQPVKISNGYKITVKNNTRYASYVEGGHLMKNGKYYHPRFMLKNSVDEMGEELPIEIDKDIVAFWNNAMERSAKYRGK